MLWYTTPKICSLHVLKLLTTSRVFRFSPGVFALNVSIVCNSYYLCFASDIRRSCYWVFQFNIVKHFPRALGTCWNIRKGCVRRTNLHALFVNLHRRFSWLYCRRKHTYQCLPEVLIRSFNILVFFITWWSKATFIIPLIVVP